MGSVAERSIRAHLTVAKFEVARLRYVEGHRSQPSNNPLALTVAKWTDLGVPARTPVVSLASVQVHVSWEDTSERWHAGRSVLAFLVWSALFKRDHKLFWEVGDIVHGNSFSWGSWSEKDWCWGKNISLVSFAFTASWT